MGKLQVRKGCKAGCGGWGMCVMRGGTGGGKGGHRVWGECVGVGTGGGGGCRYGRWGCMRHNLGWGGIGWFMAWAGRKADVVGEWGSAFE